MSELYGFDAYAPRAIAERIEQIGVAKARMPLLQMLLLAILAGAFISLGALYYTLVQSDPSLGYGLRQLLSGLVFSLGLVLVVVAGAELFTGNNLLAMAWADGRISSVELLRNWSVVCLGNLFGALGMALLVYLSGHPQANGGAVGETYLHIAESKAALPALTALVRGVLCNVLVCMAVWMSMAGRSVLDKVVAVVFPISAFVAAGFEHSIANFYFFPLAFLLQGEDGTLTLAAMLGNLLPVIVGNILGGSVLVGLVYHLIYRRAPQ